MVHCSVNLTLSALAEKKQEISIGDFSDDLTVGIMYKNGRIVKADGIEICYNLISYPEGADPNKVTWKFSDGDELSLDDVRTETTSGITSIKFKPDQVPGDYRVAAYVDEEQYPEFKNSSKYIQTEFVITAAPKIEIVSSNSDFPDRVFAIESRDAIDDFTVKITPELDGDVEYEWEWYPADVDGKPIEAYGHTPLVTFEELDNKTVKAIDTKWFAYNYVKPKNADLRRLLVTGQSCVYGIKCTATIGQKKYTSKVPAKLIVRVGYKNNSFGGVKIPKFRGVPAVEDSGGNWRVVGMGDPDKGGLVKYFEGIPHVYVDDDSEFHAKFLAHEGHHIDQFTNDSRWKYLWDVDMFYQNKLHVYYSTTAKTKLQFMAELKRIITKGNKAEKNKYNELLWVMEDEAWAKGNIERPEYLNIYDMSEIQSEYPLYDKSNLTEGKSR